MCQIWVYRYIYIEREREREMLRCHMHYLCVSPKRSWQVEALSTHEDAARVHTPPRASKVPC